MHMMDGCVYVCLYHGIDIDRGIGIGIGIAFCMLLIDIVRVV